MAAPQRRVGSESSATRHQLLDAVERLMAADGYATVTYRKLAAAVGVSAASVQYYFPTLDEIFLATLRRRSGENLQRLRERLETTDDPLRTIWEFSRGEAAGPVTAEFLALGNHRKTIAAEIAAVTDEVRSVQLEAMSQLRRKTFRLNLDPAALVVLLNGVPKLLQLEESTGIDAGHQDLIDAIERLIS